MTSPAASWADVGDRVRASRLAAGLTQAELAARVPLHRTMISKIEAGDREVDALELYALADALRVPLAHLIAPAIPAVVSRRDHLREEGDDADRLRYRLDVQLEEHARRVGWLVDGGWLTPAPTFRGSAADAGEARTVAAAARGAVGAQDGPLPDMVEVAERLALYVTVVDLPVDGASLSAGPWGAAVVGADAAPGRRRMTAAHELGHHVLGDAYSSDVGVAASRDAREGVVRAFAAELLLPQEVVRRALAKARDDDARYAALIRVAAEYRVSWSVAVAVAEQADSTVPGQRLRARPPGDADFLRVVGNLPAPDVPPGATGPQYRRSVLRALDDTAITPSRASELLYGVVSSDELAQATRTS